MNYKHFALLAADGTKRVWQTERLWRLAKELPVKDVPIESIAAFDEVTWFGYLEPTCRRVAEHARRIHEATFEHPVILSAEGYVMDGMHRICKAFFLNMPTIQAVQFSCNPEPDECLMESPPQLRAGKQNQFQGAGPVSQSSTPQVRVRVLVPADAEAYRSVRLQALQEQPPAFGSLPEDEPDLSETAARLGESDDRCFFGAFQNEELIGIVRLSRYSAANEKHRAYLAGLYVLPPCRRAGGGRALVRMALVRAATSPGIRRVNLSVVSQQEAAIRLYQSLGFRIYGTEQEAFSSGGQFHDEHLMTLELNSDNEDNAVPGCN